MHRYTGSFKSDMYKDSNVHGELSIELPDDLSSNFKTKLTLKYLGYYRHNDESTIDFNSAEKSMTQSGIAMYGTLDRETDQTITFRVLEINKTDTDIRLTG